MVGVEDHCSVLDCIARVCAICVDHVEAKIGLHHRDTENKETKIKTLAVSVELVTVFLFLCGSMTLW